ncbi:hypothetical protein [Bradyrhizobium sp. OK095]|uniref:hypothetical protein n=1 Tax=Bradyrhizobium sp. OK095 TaxID=1882760 RepID=UPI0015A5013A|nr:hypothetical protein [Bradyrhizobium sp. OK095]
MATWLYSLIAMWFTVSGTRVAPGPVTPETLNEIWLFSVMFVPTVNADTLEQLAATAFVVARGRPIAGKANVAIIAKQRRLAPEPARARPGSKAQTVENNAFTPSPPVVFGSRRGPRR